MLYRGVPTIAYGGKTYRGPTSPYGITVTVMPIVIRFAHGTVVQYIVCEIDLCLNVKEKL